MLNVPRRYRGYIWCAENKRFRLSNFPSLSQLSLSSDVASRARAHVRVRVQLCMQITSAPAGSSSQPRGTETPTAERQDGGSVGRSVGREHPPEIEGSWTRDGLFSRRLKLKLGCIV